MNASTFTARVIASTLSDMHSAITGAIGALKGPLHGGANEQVMQLLQSIPADASVEDEIRARLDRKERIMGFGHRVYKTWDPRAVILKRFSKQLAEESGEPRWYDMSEQIEHTVVAEKGLYPNVDFYSASTYHYLGIDTGLFTPIFAMSRVVGWAAHVIEQHADNRLIRPSSEYVGPAVARLRADRAPRGAPPSCSAGPRAAAASSRPGRARSPTRRYARTAATLRGSTSSTISRRPSRSNAYRQTSAVASVPWPDAAVGGLADQDREARPAPRPELQAGVPDHRALADLLDAERDQVRVGQRLPPPRAQLGEGRRPRPAGRGGRTGSGSSRGRTATAPRRPRPPGRSGASATSAPAIRSPMVMRPRIPAAARRSRPTCAEPAAAGLPCARARCRSRPSWPRPRSCGPRRATRSARPSGRAAPGLPAGSGGLVVLPWRFCSTISSSRSR